MVRKELDNSSGRYQFVPREFRDQLEDEDGTTGYVYLSSANPWSNDWEQVIEKIPEDWLETKNDIRRLKSGRKLPQDLQIYTNGILPDNDGTEPLQSVTFLTSPFSFCLNCGVSYAPHKGISAKLASLNSEGRSSATTILSLSAIRLLRMSDLQPEAQKLLSFTDNRQDASLQAGHFNDFIELGLLRGAIYGAVEKAGEIRR